MFCHPVLTKHLVLILAVLPPRFAGFFAKSCSFRCHLFRTRNQNSFFPAPTGPSRREQDPAEHSHRRLRMRPSKRPVSGPKRPLHVFRAMVPYSQAQSHIYLSWSWCKLRGFVSFLLLHSLWGRDNHPISQMRKLKFLHHHHTAGKRNDPRACFEEVLHIFLDF